LLLGLVFACASLAVARAEDWPVFRHDNERTGVSGEKLALPLGEVWRRSATVAPQPAWPLPAGADVYHARHGLQPTRVSDWAFHPVVAGKRLYYGSSGDDTLTCVDISTGLTQWAFVTEGPIRLAPAVVGDRVYFGSDDGHVYCVDAKKGKLIWKYRAAPFDHRIPGNGRMISYWPVRCGVVVDDGLVYFGAGVFPTQGVYLCAIKAEDGEPVWKQKVNITVEGHIVATPNELIVLTGRTGAQTFDRKTGKHTGGLPGGGSAFVLLSGTTFAYGPNETGRMTRLDLRQRNKPAHEGGRQMLVHEGRVYRHSPGALVLNGGWQAKLQTCYSLIMAGGVLYAGSDGAVVAFDAADGKQLWTAKAEGKVYALAAARGRLFASTDKGTIHCFGKPGAKTKHVSDIVKPRKHLVIDKRYTSAADAIVKRANVRKGYCLVLDCGEGQLAYELAKRTKWRIIGVDSDPKNVKRARKLIRKAGLYGSRAVIHQIPSGRLPYARHFANVITSDAFARKGRVPSVSAAVVRRVLRPDGGALVLAGPGDRQKLAKWGGQTFADWQAEKDGKNLAALYRRPALPGAGTWTHLYGDPANTACSNDAHATGPVRLQWFGRPGPRRMVDRHNRTTSPVYSKGRVYISGTNHLVGADAYNGTILWQQDVPYSVRLAVSKDCGNLAAAEDAIYLAAGSQCLAFDAETGEKKLTMATSVPVEGVTYDWGYVCRVGDLLLGSASRRDAGRRVQSRHSWKWGYLDHSEITCSDELFAMDRHKGRTAWSYRPETGVIINPAIAVGGERVYLVESTNPETRKVANGRVKLGMLLGKGSQLVALDLRTGRVAWRQAVDLKALQHAIFLSYAEGLLVVSGSRNLVVKGKQVMRYDLRAFDAATGVRRWSTTPDADGPVGGSHGEQDQHPAIVGDLIYYKTFACDLKTGKRVAEWTAHGGGCGATAASLNSMFYRAGNPNMTDLATGKETRLTVTTRPGCWINIIPVGGMILVPEGSSGCTCGYPIQTSFAMTRDPVPELKAGELLPGAVAVSMSCPVDGAVIRYTLDGSTPTDDSPAYEKPLRVPYTGTIRARAFFPDGESSFVQDLALEPLKPKKTQ